MHRPSTDVLLRSLAASVACALVATAQERSEPAKLLEKFFDLGLPDAKGGKWSRIVPMDSAGGEGSLDGGLGDLTGNGWVLRESRGAVEAVMADGRAVRGRKMKDEDGETANLDADLKTFMEALKSKKAQMSRGDDDAQEKARMAGGALLFLAQLQRQGRGDFVREALPQVLAQVPSPEMALDGAVTMLANAQLATLLQAWVENGDAAAYAAGIDRIAAAFPRGWMDRDAALLLAAGLREQKPAKLAGDADAKQAADFLLKLKVGDFRQLPAGWNWFISEAGGRRRMSGFPGFDAEESGEGNEEPQPTGKPVTKNGTVAAFFAKKREAAMAMAKLLDDRRYVRSGGAVNSDGGHGFSIGEHKSREEMIREQYNQIARPREMGEIAWAVLSPLLPDSLRNEAQQRPAGRAASVMAWLKAIAAKSDEELAWDYLRSATGTYDDDFRNGLGFLLEKGGPETLAKLKEVFLDPGVWSGGSMDEMIGYTQQYVKRAPADAAFPDKLRAAAKAGFAMEEAGNSRYSQGYPEEMKKQLAARRAAQMKQLDQIFKAPQSLAEQLAEIVAMEEMEALAAMNTFGRALAKTPLPEIETAIFQAAAKAKSPMLKAELLQLVMNVGMFAARLQPPGKAGAPPAVPGDAATREAMLALLRDETLVQNRWNPSVTTTIWESTAWALILIHSAEARQNEWQRFTESAPHLAKKWARTHALAIAGGHTPPPLPDASRLAAGRAAVLVAELGALPVNQIAAAIDGKSPDEQLAIVGHLEKSDQWPATLVNAHLTISEVSGDAVAGLDGAAWKGRQLDENLVREIPAALEKAAGEGKFHAVVVSVSGPLAGAEISVVNSANKMQPEQLASFAIPGLSGRPAPSALVFASIQPRVDGPRGIVTGFGFPIWKDPAITRAWRDEHGKAKPEQEKMETGKGAFSVNPGPFDQKLRDYLSRQKNARGAFQLMISSAIIGKNDE